MRDQKGKSVQDILSELNAEQKSVVERLRAMVKRTLPKAEEVVKWGNLTYVLEGENLAWILIYKDHADFGFFRGTELSSPMLEGTGKGLRHIKIIEYSDTLESEIGRLLEEAAELAPLNG